MIAPSLFMPPTAVFHLGLHQSACELLDELVKGRPVLNCLFNCREGLARKKELGFCVIFTLVWFFPMPILSLISSNCLLQKEVQQEVAVALREGRRSFV